jgi:hypothetical protein
MMGVVLGDGVLQVPRNHGTSGGLPAGEALQVAIVVEEEGALLDGPPVVAPADHDAHLLEVVLPDVADVEVSVPVEGKPVGVPEAERVDLLHRAGRADEGIVPGDPIPAVGRARAIDVDAMDLAQGDRELLAVAVQAMPDDRRLHTARSGHDEELAVPIVRAASVTHRDVEIPVGTEGQVPAVVVELGPVDTHQLAATTGLDARCRIGRDVGLPLTSRHDRGTSDRRVCLTVGLLSVEVSPL